MKGLGELVGVGRVADVHAYGEHVVKLYRSARAKADTFTEAGILAVVEGHGVPAPRVHEAGLYGERWGLVIDRIEGPTLAAQMLGNPARLGECLDEMVRLHLIVHACVEARLRSVKGRLQLGISRASQLDPKLRERLLGGLAAMPDGDRICHGDFHPLNIVGAPGRATIIDWLDAAAGAPAADVCRSYVLIKNASAEAAADYVERYARASGTPTSDIFRWLPYVAAARLAEGIAAEEAALIEMASAM